MEDKSVEDKFFDKSKVDFKCSKEWDKEVVVTDEEYKNFLEVAKLLVKEGKAMSMSEAKRILIMKGKGKEKGKNKGKEKDHERD